MLLCKIFSHALLSVHSPLKVTFMSKIKQPTCGPREGNSARAPYSLTPEDSNLRLYLNLLLSSSSSSSFSFFPVLISAWNLSELPANWDTLHRREVSTPLKKRRNSNGSPTKWPKIVLAGAPPTGRAEQYNDQPQLIFTKSLIFLLHLFVDGVSQMAFGGGGIWNGRWNKSSIIVLPYHTHVLSVVS